MPDESHTRLVVNPEAVEMLNAIHNSIAIVGVVGPYHSGKSFLMNQLLGRVSGFAIGPSVEPTTRGLWLWGAPLEITRTDGTTLSVLFLDTEGFYATNVSEEYDAKVFAVTTLLSSLLLYNSVKTIDAASIDYVELLARRTHLFGFKAALRNILNGSVVALETVPHAATNNSSFLAVDLPPLIWVVQDFFQELSEFATATDWLHAMIAGHHRDFREGGSSENMRTLSALFPNISCHTIFLPHSSKDKLRRLDSVTSEDEFTAEYRNDIKALRDKIFRQISPKHISVSGRTPAVLTGPALGTLTQLLVDYANLPGEFPVVPSVWHNFLADQQRKAADEAIKLYRETIRRRVWAGEPLTLAEFGELHNRTAEAATQLIGRILFGLPDLVVPALAELERSAFTDMRSQFLTEATTRVGELCSKVAAALRDKHRNALDSIELPLPRTTLQTANQEATDSVMREFDEAVGKYRGYWTTYAFALEQLKRDLQGTFDGKMLANIHALEKALESAVHKAVTAYDEAMTHAVTNSPQPLDRDEWQRAHEVAERSAWEAFENYSAVAKSESSYSAFRLQAGDKLKASKHTFWTANEDRVKQLLRDLAKDAFGQARRSFGETSATLPVDTETLEQTCALIAQVAIDKFKGSVPAKLSSWSFYDEILHELTQQLRDQEQLLHQQNVAQMKIACRESLEKALRTIRSQEHNFYFRWTFLNWAREVVLHELSKRVASVKLREQVAADFINKEMHAEHDNGLSGVLLAVGTVVVFITGALFAACCLQSKKVKTV